MRLLTWNVCFEARAFRERTIGLLRAIAASDAEVVALQEVTPPLLGLLREFAAQRGYVVRGGDGTFGYDVALLARDPGARFASLALPSVMGRRAIALVTNDGAIATVHLESTAGYGAARCAQLALIGPWLAGLDSACVLAGDLNFDEYDARECDVLDDAWVDAWPLLRPGEPGATCGKRRFDHVFARNWRPRDIALVGDAAISDHRGVLATF